MPSRRHFLAGLGASLLAGPLNYRLAPPAFAGGGSPARRLLVFATPNGTVPHRLWPVGSERDFVFKSGSILEPLTDLRDRLTILKGLNFFEANNHEGGMAAMLTNGGGSSSETQGMSLDQYVAQHIGEGTRFRSLELGVQTSAWGGNSQTRMCYAGSGSYVTPDDSPMNVFERMFGSVEGGASAAELLQARRGSVLDLVRSELADLHGRLGRAERAKLEVHLDALRTTEEGLASGLESASTCEPGSAPLLAGGIYDNDAFPSVGTAQMDLAVSALACGLTRVASIQWSHTVGPVVFSWLGLNEGHHSLSHIDNSNPEGIADYVLAERWYAEQFASLLRRLEELPDPEGEGSLLDSTLVVWAQELGDGREHICEDVPFILAGATGRLEHGRFLDLGGRNHAHLLVSLCHTLGLGNTTFGNPSAGVGPLGELA